LLLQQLYAKTKALDVVDNDVDYHFHGLKLSQPVIDPSSMKRLHRAQLSAQDSERVIEVLGKIAAIAKSRQDAVEELAEVTDRLRQSEFARERADSMATARGEALMRCQDALSEAEEQQVQLSGLLRSALEQLGVGSPVPAEDRLITSQKAPASVSTAHAAKFKYANITPPSGSGLMPCDYRRDRTPLTGFTVYSNPVSEELGAHDDFATPGLNTTYYSSCDEDDQENSLGSNYSRPTTATRSHTHG